MVRKVGRKVWGLLYPCLWGAGSPSNTMSAVPLLVTVRHKTELNRSTHVYLESDRYNGGGGW